MTLRAQPELITLMALLVCSCTSCAVAPNTAVATSQVGPVSSSSGPVSSSSGSPECTARQDASPAALADCVDPARYTEDLRFIAQPRASGEPHWQAVQDLCFERLVELGYETERHTYATGVNVLGRRLGTRLPDEIVLLSAHYDSVPDCAGADDNATGVAGALEAARVLAETDFERTVMIACWDEEERGLVGSTAYAREVSLRQENIVANFNFEMIGFTSETEGSQRIPTGFDLLFPEAYGQIEDDGFRGNFITIVADDLIRDGAEALDRHAKRLGLATVWIELDASLKTSPLLLDLRRSDHAPFWDKDIPAMMITDTSNFRYDPYHCASGPDVIENLDHAFSSKVVAATVAAVAETLGM